VEHLNRREGIAATVDVVGAVIPSSIIAGGVVVVSCSLRTRRQSETWALAVVVHSHVSSRRCGNLDSAEV
jgi:hypothetical protein